ncbi:MAG TPA: hypothetical protein VK809_09275, partial [Bacteroidia bacterium]|nr:hypothetical protein [Bacteroidia bacterium]
WRKICSAFLGSLQKSGASVVDSNSAILVNFFSTSKMPPQRVKALLHILNLLVRYHYYYAY